MDRDLISAIAHRSHPIAAPVSEAALRRLVGRLAVPGGGRVLDLGCGAGQWLLATLDAAPTATGTGVDRSVPALAVVRRGAADRGLAERVRFERADAAGWAGGRFDAVLCIGATHPFGGLAATLDAVRRHLVPGGRLLLGEGFWDGEPTAAALHALGAGPGELSDLPGLVAAVQERGYEPGHGHVSSAAEWDDYEWSWTGALTEWALTEAGPGDRDAALAAARTHRLEWLTGYRAQLGFLTVVLHDTRPR